LITPNECIRRAICREMGSTGVVEEFCGISPQNLPCSVCAVARVEALSRPGSRRGTLSTR
jgi:hypothetical protein